MFIHIYILYVYPSLLNFKCLYFRSSALPQDSTPHCGLLESKFDLPETRSWEEGSMDAAAC